MRIRLYTYPTCTTSRKARQYLQAKGVQFEEVNLKDGLSEKELDRLIGERDVREFFNPRHPLYRERKIRSSPPPRDEALRLLASDPRLIRRPMLEAGDRLILGFDPAAYDGALTGV